MKFLLIISLLFIISFGCKEEVNILPANELAERLLKDRSKDFKFILNNHEQNGDKVSVTTQSGKVIIEGSSNIALTYGLYSYLKHISAAMVNWEGTRIDLSKNIKDGTLINFSTPFKYRSYLNVCAFGYTTPWWNWDRWEQEIDWMALHGINMPTAMEGQEVVLNKLWSEFGLNEDELNNHFTGPAFLPWQRMGNINNHQGPLPESWLAKKHDLQIKILERMHSLGMKPVVPAFNGYVPKVFLEKFPNAKIHKMESWGGGLEETYWLDPMDTLFARIGKRFIEIYSEIYGKENYYLIDAFNEMKPPVSAENKLEELTKYGSSIYKTIKETNPNGKWIMQGWLFGDDKEFWTPEAVAAFLREIPNDKMIIQDFGNDRREVWKDANAFYGKEWIYGYVHNYGGTNPVFGDLEFYNTQLTDLQNNPNKKNLIGYGVMPEGLNTNSVVYEYIYDLAWSTSGLELDNWLILYTKARYGKSSANSEAAWNLFKKSVYNTKYWTPRWWEGAGTYLFNKRPTLNITEFAGHPGDLCKLEQGIKLLIKDSDIFKENEFYKYDLLDFTKHYLSIKLDSILVKCVDAYSKNDLEKGDELYTKSERLSYEIDSLIAGQPLNSLNYWLSSAWNYGESESESKLYLQNAKMQITVWGGNHLKDYASKSWHGMYREFYWPRWNTFLKSFREANVKNEQFDELIVQEKIRNWEIEWTKEPEMYPRNHLIKPIEYAIFLMDKYSNCK
ncbi:MAG: alpha-N-acetylglucosaminidase [Bacteroidetes bacterium]|nr:alpha-N-acetylglucosaminidase [Bacteroidota bacterium]